MDLDVEVVVADTGSTDGTLEMLKDIQKKATAMQLVIGHFEWINDFAAAKNYAVSLSSNEYVCVLDSDEWIKEIDLADIYKSIANNPNAIFRIKIVNVYEREGEQFINNEWINRLYNKNLYEYSGRIHEQLVSINGTGTDKLVKVPLSIWHDGYGGTEEAIRSKAERNIKLLKEALAEKEEPYILYQLGKSYYMQKDYATAVEYLGRGLEYDLDPRLEYVIDMVETYGYALINSNQADKAIFFENIYEEFGDCADFKFLMGLIYMNNYRFEDAIKEFEKATRYKECRMEGSNSYLAYYNAGVIRECLGDVASAKKYYLKCGSYKKAQDRLSKLA